MDEEKIRGKDIGWLGDPDTDWMWDLNHPERRERVEKLMQEMLKGMDFPKVKGPIIISTANPNPNSWIYDNFVQKSVADPDSKGTEGGDNQGGGGNNNPPGELEG